MASTRTRLFTRGDKITQTVTLPGITRPDGSPVTMDIELVVDEVAEDWVCLVDWNAPTGPAGRIYGNHPHAVGSLNDAMPGSVIKRPYPRTLTSARDRLISVTVDQNIRISHASMVQVDGPYPARSILVHLPRCTGNEDAHTALAAIREYQPYRDVTVTLRGMGSDYRSVLVAPVTQKGE